MNICVTDQSLQSVAHQGSGILMTCLTQELYSSHSKFQSKREGGENMTSKERGANQNQTVTPAMIMSECLRTKIQAGVSS